MLLTYHLYSSAVIGVEVKKTSHVYIYNTIYYNMATIRQHTHHTKNRLEQRKKKTGKIQPGIKKERMM